MDIDPINVSQGMDKVWNHDNIAVTVLVLMAIFEAALIVWLVKGILMMKDVLNSLIVSINTLNERIKHD